jgi:hypothetical protein
VSDRDDSGRKFFAVDLDHEDFKGMVGPFSSREAAEQWQDQLVIEGLYAGTSGTSNVTPLYGPVEAEELIRRGRAQREREMRRIAGDLSDESFASRMGHPGGLYF